MPDTPAAACSFDDRLDIVYLLGPGSTFNDKELMYSMRSVFKHVRNYRRIFVLGSVPQCSEPIGVPFEFVPLPDPNLCKQQNQRAKLLAAVNSPVISDPFLLMNDDFLFLQDLSEPGALPLYRYGMLPAHIEWRAASPGDYLDSLRLTDSALRRASLPRRDFEVHGPILLHKAALEMVLDDFAFPEWASSPGPCYRSLYANYLQLEGVPHEDCKVDYPLPSVAAIAAHVANRPFFSLGPGGCNRAMEEYLRMNFPSI